MERTELLIRAAAWMQVRDWKEKLAKKRGFEQSSFYPKLTCDTVVLQRNLRWQ